MKQMGKLVAFMGAGLLLISNLALAQSEPYQEGVHYFKIDQAVAERDYVEVRSPLVTTVKPNQLWVVRFQPFFPGVIESVIAGWEIADGDDLVIDVR